MREFLVARRAWCSRATRRLLASSGRRVWRLGAAAAAVALLAGLGASQLLVAGPAGARGSHNERRTYRDGLGIEPGKIKHVWLIILENKSYDATFTGLNRNTYLWQDLPHQGVLLRNYYATGHFSFDNYISLVSGQAPQPDSQHDCPYYKYFEGYVDMSGKLNTNPNYGQMTATRTDRNGQTVKEPYGNVGTNGCVYPPTVKTLFNQLDAAGISWKGYAQDLGNEDPPESGPKHSAGVQYCGAPYPSPAKADPTSKGQPNPHRANATDQYLPKHFPFAWFASLLPGLGGSTDCNAKHIASLSDPNNGLYHDLQHEATTPAFSWITPNMCSDGHDAVCAGNNLAGDVFGKCGQVIKSKPQKDWTGGLYAVDLFLEHVIPEIECSPAYNDGGLIDITFDEASAPFTYSGNSFYNSTTVAPNAATAIRDASAGETIDDQSVCRRPGPCEKVPPAGPNVPLDTAYPANWPGPGNSVGVHRPSGCEQERDPNVPLSPTTCLLGAGRLIPGVSLPRMVSAVEGSPVIQDDQIVIIDNGRKVVPVAGNGIPDGGYVAKVNNGFMHATKPGGRIVTGSFTLVDKHGKELTTTKAPSKAPSKATIKLGAECAPGPKCESPDPLFDDKHATTGGGDTGSVLISPYITPGTCSDVVYNHYSWLRTMEDLFGLAGGLDGRGHLGYAAQLGLVPFGTDVFNRPIRPPNAACPKPRTAALAYGTQPDWLPPVTSPVDGVLQASPAHPVLAVQGETIAARLPRGRVLVTAAGPAVPSLAGTSLQAEVRCTFTVTLNAVSGSMPLTPAAFTAVDQQGGLHHLRLTASGGLPQRLRPGHALTVTLRAVLPVGQGRLTWTPTGGAPMASWDFEVEID